LMAVCASARAAKAQTPTSTAIQRFMTAPFAFLARSRSRPDARDYCAECGPGRAPGLGKVAARDLQPSGAREEYMAEYDLVIRNGTIATASDVVKGDIGIVAGRVVALGERLDKGKREIDATGLIAVPGGIDAHVHFDQDTADGSEFCDDFESGSRAAAAGGTTTIIPFAYQSKGQPLRDAVNRYHKRAEGKSLIDYAFHVILSDPSEKIMGQDFTGLVADGYTSFKVYMTYDDLKLTDRELLDALAAARREQAMLMIHAENSDCIGWLTERLELKG